MKNFIKMLGLVLALLAGPKLVMADQWDGGDFRSGKGGKLASGSSIVMGRNPGNIVTQSFPATSVFNGTIDIGDVVVLASVTTIAGVKDVGIAVTRTTSVGVPAFGIALSKTTAVGQKTIIATQGLVMAKISYVGMTVGDDLITSSTAGGLTKSTAATEGISTQVSRTAIVGDALDTKSITGFGRVVLNK